MFPITVLIPTHNPRLDWLARVLEALRAQDLPLNQWELVVIDNASQRALEIDLTWHPQARVVREEKLGLTPARLRGIREAQGKWLVFVDDDNVLDVPYLREVLAVAARHPELGVIGAGQLRAEYEQEPSDEVRPFLWMLAQGHIEQPMWSTLRARNPCIPVGAGLCILREAALDYAATIEQDDVRRGLDRSGSELLSCGDRDMAMLACDRGWGAGLFPELTLIHLLAARRLQPDYLVKLFEGNAASHVVLDAIWGDPEGQPSLRDRLRYIKALLTRRGLDRRIYFAERRGKARGREIAARLERPR